MEPTQIRLTIPDSVDPTRLMGPADSLLRRIEQAFDAMVVVRGNTITISGAIEVVEQASTVFSRLMRQVEVGEAPTVDDVDVVIEHVKHGAAGYSILSDDVLLTYRGRTIRPKTAGQKRYIDSIRSNTITFGIGPAGTGKTYLAMACAVAALKRREVGRIVLCRPVVEAGESLGYLPGTLDEKLDPYVRPLYDALFDMTDMEKGNALIEQGVIEIAPLAFMRGRTLNDAFVILDEAQNTTPEQMKMFLTRLGFSSKFVVTGDATQRDLLGKCGLDQARDVLEGIEGISCIDLDRNDIVRHSLEARIVDAIARGEGGDARGS
ncbi:MAG: PhoH family protein, partial [Atopobiaceae bacterium]|nr:PhoH family protein [Atopobiaceae bacterium]